MNKLQILGNRMIEVATTHQDDFVANQFSRVGELLMHQGQPFVAKLTAEDEAVVQFFKARYSA
jgi:hypothetical protein